MDAQNFDGITRRAAAGSRRGSLLALGTVGLAAIAAPLAGKGKKKNNTCKKDKKQLQQSLETCNGLCQQQVTACTNHLASTCGNRPACTSLLECCSLLGTCDAAAYFACLVNRPPVPPP